MEDFHPPCDVCGKNLFENYVTAMGKNMHNNCFLCMRCGSSFPGIY